MQNMINYVKDMFDYDELRRQAEIYDCDILELEDEYLQIPKMVNDVSFTYLNNIVGVWNPRTLFRFCEELVQIKDRKCRTVSRKLMSGSNCVEFTTNGYELRTWYHCMSDKNNLRFYFLPIGNNDFYGYLIPIEERKSMNETVRCIYIV